ncbi:hypothetical protein [Thiolapillus sp.]
MYSIHYGRWFEDRFGESFDVELVKRMQSLPDSRDLFNEMLLQRSTLE